MKKNMVSASQPPARNPNKLAGEVKTLEQWQLEREILLNRIESLELQVEQFPRESSPIKPPVHDILKDFYALGLKIFEVEPSNDFISAPIVTQALMNMSTKLKDSGSIKTKKLLGHINPVNNNPGHVAETIDCMVQEIFKLYVPPGEVTYLAGNFAAVKCETPPRSDLVVEEGHIPENLNGMMLRNGPNPHFAPEGNYMWMDGESMIHGIRFQKGKTGSKATYVARYTKTARFVQQAKFKKAQLIKYGDLVGPYGLFATFVQELRRQLHILDGRFGITTANTGLVYHAKRIMALEDFGQPHVIYVNEEVDLKTLGINNYDEKLDHWLSPHPRKDPVTGQMFNFGSMRTSPYCIYRIISKDGVISEGVPITVPEPTYMHELCITENYVIFQDLPYVYDPKKMETEKTEWIFNFDDTKKPRYGILPRNATSEKDKDGNPIIKWFTFEKSFFVFHNANAWEEDDDTIVLYCCCMDAVEAPNSSGRQFVAPAMFRRFNNKDDFEPTMPVLYKMTFNIKTHEKPTRKKVSDIGGDWPKINQKYFGRKTQFVYIGEVNDDNKIISVVKYDLEKEYGHPTRFRFDNAESPTRFGSEVVFVPKTDSSTAREDDGYLITFVHHESPSETDDGISYVYVIDANTMESVAKIRLPSRVPYGFHAIYVTEEDLQNQLKPATT